MKRNSLNRIAIFLIIILAGIKLHAQNDEATIKNIVEAQHFIFKAQTAIPSGSASRQLESNYYDVIILKDSVIAFLPYFGRTYCVTNYPSDGGINFTSTKFDYSIIKGRKGGWDISIEPKDARDIRELSFSISSGGSAQLQVMSDNRQPISFYGYVTELN